jgi:hypothetical protein
VHKTLRLPNVVGRRRFADRPNTINLRWNSCLGSTRTATNCTKYTKRAKK